MAGKLAVLFVAGSSAAVPVYLSQSSTSHSTQSKIDIPNCSATYRWQVKINGQHSIKMSSQTINQVLQRSSVGATSIEINRKDEWDKCQMQDDGRHTEELR
ncbi:hypothetical protein [Mycoplasma ovis]|uniref:hypothetical protein n=1 Tax=Mycoplasma ovis TaxID=171632 RepID=UPI00118368D7|nr:hypothetical protein [Mycoplasma ovis]